MPSEPAGRDQPPTAPGSSTPESSAGQASLEEVLDQYLRELADGKEPDQEQYLNTHPQLADALRGLFRTLDFVEATSRSLRGSALERGQALGEYRIVREIGRGGMGVVYEAVQTSLNRRVALKVLPAGALLSDTAAERFAREAATAASLHHTNIVPVYAVGETQGIHYYAMQYIEGSSLSAYLKKLRDSGTPLGRDHFEQVARWGRQVADALAYAHGKGTIHRDVKPSNVLLDRRGNAWITDFGLARTGVHTTITVTGDVLGTARYMSPEQAGGGIGGLDERTDVYSLGATLYELITLQPAFDGETREEVLGQITLSSPKPIRQLCPAVPRDLQTIVGKCMEREPQRRYPRADEVAEDCRRFLARDPIRARRTPALVKAARWAGRHRFQVATSAVACGLVVLALFLVYHGRRVRGETLVEEAVDAVLLSRDANQATELLDHAERLGVDSARLHFARSLIPMLLGQRHRAVPALRRAYARAPDDVEVNLALACACTASGDMADVERYLRAVNPDEITTALGWLLRGHTLRALEDRSDLEAYNRALALRPNLTLAIEARAYSRAPRILVDGEREALQPMLDDLDAWIRLWPESASAYSARGIGLTHASAYARTQLDLQDESARWVQQALESFETALAHGPSSRPYILAQRGTLYRTIGDFDSAARDLEEAIHLDQEASGDAHPAMLHHYAIVLHASGRLEEALKTAEQAAEAAPGFFAPPLQQALVLAEMGRSAEARQVCLEALSRRQDDPTALSFIGMTLALLGDGQAADVIFDTLAQGRRTGLTPSDVSREGLEAQIAYWSGRISADAVRALAHDHPGSRCATEYLIAMRELAHGRREAGLAALQACVDTGVYTFVQYRFAQVLLARAQADPQWPRWLSGVSASESNH